jgi:putative intracellular protease/amidase
MTSLFVQCLIEDGKLTTGQNPASSEAVAKALVAQLK